MSDDIPDKDAEDVLRVIRGDGTGRTSERRKDESRAGGTFLLTSVHRIAGSDQETDGRSTPSEPIRFRPPPWERGRAAQSRDSGADPSRERPSSADDAFAALPSVPGLEDPAAVPRRAGPSRPAPGHLATDPRPDASAAPDALDESALRRLIEEVLDERLGGDLGNRVTRNIRRLVRAEVARALSDRNGSDD